MVLIIYLLDITFETILYKYEDKLDNTEALFDTVLAETEKIHSEQNIDFELLMEEIEKYCDYTVRK